MSTKHESVIIVNQLFIISPAAKVLKLRQNLIFKELLEEKDEKNYEIWGYLGCWGYSDETLFLKFLVGKNSNHRTVIAKQLSEYYMIFPKFREYINKEIGVYKDEQ